MKRHLAAVALAIFAFEISTMPANAVLVAGWEMNGLSSYGTSPFNPIVSDPNATVTGLSRGPGIATAGTSATNGWGGNGTNTTSLANAISSNDFLSFTLKANSGYTLSLSDIGPYNVRRSGAGATTGQWQYRIDSNAWSNIESAITWGSNTSATGNLQSTIILSGISALQGVDSSSTIGLRLVLWGATDTGGNWYLNNFASAPSGRDFTVNGSFALAPVPEPTAALFGSLLAGAFGLTVARRPAGRE